MRIRSYYRISLILLAPVSIIKYQVTTLKDSPLPLIRFESDFGLMSVVERSLKSAVHSASTCGKWATDGQTHDSHYQSKISDESAKKPLVDAKHNNY